MGRKTQAVKKEGCIARLRLKASASPCKSAATKQEPRTSKAEVRATSRFLPTAFCFVPAVSHLLQGNFQIANDVVPVLEANGNSDALGMHAESALLFVGQG